MGRKAISRRLEKKNSSQIIKKSKGKRGKLQQWEEACMRLAVQEYIEHRENPYCLSLRALARAYEVPHSTLSDRIKLGRDEMKPKIGRKTVFTSAQETELAELLIYLSKRGFGLTCLDVRRLAYQFAEKKRNRPLL